MTDFRLQLTDIGLAKQAAAIANSTVITLAEIAVGDGGGDYYTLDPAATGLVNEFYRFAFAAGDINVDPVNNNKILMEGHIPATEGGNTTREIGIFDDAGDMIAHGLFPLIDIPSGTGARVDVYVKEYLEVSNSSVFSIEVDTSNAAVSRDKLAQDLSDHNTDPAAHDYLARLNGNSGEVFSVADATQDEHAVNKGQLDSKKEGFCPKGMLPAYVDGTTIQISAGERWDSTGTKIINLGSATNVDISGIGALTSFYVFVGKKADDTVAVEADINSDGSGLSQITQEKILRFAATTDGSGNVRSFKAREAGGNNIDVFFNSHSGHLEYSVSNSKDLNVPVALSTIPDNIIVDFTFRVFCDRGGNQEYFYFYNLDLNTDGATNTSCDFAVSPSGHEGGYQHTRKIENATLYIRSNDNGTGSFDLFQVYARHYKLYL